MSDYGFCMEIVNGLIGKLASGGTVELGELMELKHVLGDLAGSTGSHIRELEAEADSLREVLSSFGIPEKLHFSDHFTQRIRRLFSSQTVIEGLSSPFCDPADGDEYNRVFDSGHRHPLTRDPAELPSYKEVLDMFGIPREHIFSQDFIDEIGQSVSRQIALDAAVERSFYVCALMDEGSQLRQLIRALGCEGDMAPGAWKECPHLFDCSSLHGTYKGCGICFGAGDAPMCPFPAAEAVDKRFDL